MIMHSMIHVQPPLYCGSTIGGRTEHDNDKWNDFGMLV